MYYLYMLKYLATQSKLNSSRCANTRTIKNRRWHHCTDLDEQVICHADTQPQFNISKTSNIVSLFQPSSNSTINNKILNIMTKVQNCTNIYIAINIQTTSVYNFIQTIFLCTLVQSAIYNTKDKKQVYNT